MVKLNDDELYELAAAYGSPYHSIEQNIGYLVELTGVKILCVTLGSHGAVCIRTASCTVMRFPRQSSGYCWLRRQLSWWFDLQAAQ